MNKLFNTALSTVAFCLALTAVLTPSNSALANSVLSTGLSPITRIVPYLDEDYGFKLAIPDNWSRIYAAVDDQHADDLEPGYAVGFESPRSSESDVYADYLMVEILPGATTGGFDSDGASAKVVMVDGRVAITDRIYLDGFDISGNSIDLVVFQAEIVELGFTVGIFVIGEKQEQEVLADAFALALKTFKVPDDPFSVS